MAVPELNEQHPFLTARHVDDLTQATNRLNHNIVTLTGIVQRQTEATNRLATMIERLLASSTST